MTKEESQPPFTKSAGAVLLEAATQSRSRILVAVRTMTLWGLSVFLWLVLLSIGWSTLTGRGALADAFVRLGVGSWFRDLAGTVELANAIALLIPRARFWGACGIAAVMLVATYANVTILHAPPLAAITALLLVAALLVAWLDPR